MSTHPTASPASAPSVSQLAAGLVRELETALTQQCARGYDAGVSVHPLTGPSEEAPGATFRIDCRGLVQLPVRLRVSHAGGNVYDIVCSVEDGETHRFSYSLPGTGGPRRTGMPHLAEEIATFLRDELERHLGRMLLRSSAASPRDDETEPREETGAPGD